MQSCGHKVRRVTTGGSYSDSQYPRFPLAAGIVCAMGSPAHGAVRARFHQHRRIIDGVSVHHHGCRAVRACRQVQDSQGREHGHRWRHQAVLQWRRPAVPGHRQRFARASRRRTRDLRTRMASRKSSRSRSVTTASCSPQNKAGRVAQPHAQGRLPGTGEDRARSGESARADPESVHHLEGRQQVAAGRRRSRCWVRRRLPARATRSPSCTWKPAAATSPGSTRCVRRTSRASSAPATACAKTARTSKLAKTTTSSCRS